MDDFSKNIYFIQSVIGSKTLRDKRARKAMFRFDNFNKKFIEYKFK